MPRLFIAMGLLLVCVGHGFSQETPPKEKPKMDLPKSKEPEVPQFFKFEPLKIDAKDTETAKLQKERVNALGEAANLETTHFGIGAGNADESIKLFRKYLEARLEITPNFADQLTLMTDYFDAMKTYHKQMEVRELAGFASKILTLSFAIEAKWAEIEVLKLKRKIAAQKKE